MSSKRRIRRNQCGRKRRHTSPTNAAIELMLIRKNHGHQGQLGVYRCPFCGFWHVGHIPEETALAQAGDKTVLTSNKGGAV